MENITLSVSSSPEFNNHTAVYRIENSELGVIGFIGIHSRRGSYASLGATRLWPYYHESEALHDALRLSRLMSHKSILANLPYGGAKAALMLPGDRAVDKKSLLTWYVSQVNELRGLFVTGSDVGVEDEDVAFMRKHSPYIIGDNIPSVYYTALGVLQGIETALEYLYGSGDVTGRTFAIQGLGKTGLELVKMLYGKAKKIFVSDIDPNKVFHALRLYPDITAMHFDLIHKVEVDVFSPCALSYSINKKTLPELHCKAVVGSANNQIENDAVEKALHQRNILYAIDAIVNNGGFISVADQYEHGSYDDARVRRKIADTRVTLRNIFHESSTRLVSPGSIADYSVASVLNLNPVYHVS